MPLKHRRLRELLLIGLLVTLLVPMFSGCQGVWPFASASPDPVVAHAIETRRVLGLRADRPWVESVVANPNSVVWNDILVSPQEFEDLVEKRVHAVIRLREAVQLPADEAIVRALLADPSTVTRGPDIPMTPSEAAAWDRRIDNEEQAWPAIHAYGTQHPGEWAGLAFDDDGTAVAFFTGHLEEHRVAIAALFVPGTVRFEVERARWSWAELQALRSELRGPWLGSQGIVIESIRVPPEANAVALEVIVREPTPGLEGRVLDHFDAAGRLVVRVAVRPAWDGGFGNVTVFVRDGAGSPVQDVDCAFVALIAGGELGDYGWDETDQTGHCALGNIPATAYRVEIWRDVDREFMGSGFVQVPDGGEATIAVTVPDDAG